MPSPTSIERGREARRRVLAAAAELIPEVGWTAVSSRLLAARAGVAPSVVHYHFASVQAVLREATMARMQAMLDASLQLFSDAIPPADMIQMLAASIDLYAHDDPAMLLFSEAYLAASRDELLRAQVAEMIDAFRKHVASYLGRHRVPHPEATAAVLASAIDGIFLHRTLDPELERIDLAPVLARLVPPPVE